MVGIQTGIGRGRFNCPASRQLRVVVGETRLRLLPGRGLVTFAAQHRGRAGSGARSQRSVNPWRADSECRSAGSVVSNCSSTGRLSYRAALVIPYDPPADLRRENARVSGYRRRGPISPRDSLSVSIRTSDQPVVESVVLRQRSKPSTCAPSRRWLTWQLHPQFHEFATVAPAAIAAGLGNQRVDTRLRSTPVRVFIEATSSGLRRRCCR